MNKIRLTLTTLAVFAVCLLCSSMAQAQACRTWVSGVGDDFNPCSRTAPCKTFGGAISKTAEGGEIDVLDPGGYGTVTITKSLTIDGGTGSGWASILASGATAGVIVNVTTNPTTAVVTLRHLSVNGVRHGTGACTAGTQGIRFLAGKVLHIESVVVFGFSSNGVDVNNSTSLPTVTIQDSTITDNGASGVSVTATSAIGATISNTTIKQNGTGVSSAANSRVTIRDSKLASNTTGVNTASGSETNITDSLVSGGTTGINVVSGATVRLGNDTIAQNSTGVANPAGSTVQSTGDSRFMGNPVDRTGAAFSPLVKQ
ncbi:MAG: right-handed parallel beta-helix repeat-containing protein [Acidobacteriota bacterium]